MQTSQVYRNDVTNGKVYMLLFQTEYESKAFTVYGKPSVSMYSE